MPSTYGGRYRICCVGKACDVIVGTPVQPSYLSYLPIFTVHAIYFEVNSGILQNPVFLIQKVLNTSSITQGCLNYGYSVIRHILSVGILYHFLEAEPSAIYTEDL